MISSSSTFDSAPGTLALAYIGDGVYELLCRERALASGRRANELHRQVVGMVCATAQSDAYGRIEPLLSEEERGVLLRGRNNSDNRVPKSSDPITYRRATAVEALFGWLYIHGEEPRIRELFKHIFEE